MTLTTTAASVTALGNSATTLWPFSFIIPTSDDIVVQITLLSNGTSTRLSNGIDYTAAPYGSPTGGYVTYPLSGAPLSSAYTITISRVVPITQETDLDNQGTLYPVVIENEFDYLTMIDQQLQAQLSRALLAPPGQTIPAIDIDALLDGLAALETALALVGGSVYYFQTRTAAAIATISTATNFINTAGFAAAGDGGASMYQRVGGNTYGGFQSADGAWWQVVKDQPKLNVKMFGAKGDGTTDDTAALLAAVAYVNTYHRVLHAPKGVYPLNQQLLFTFPYASLTSTDRVGLQGEGAAMTQFLWTGLAGADAAIKFYGDISNVLNFNAHTSISDFTINSDGPSLRLADGLWIQFRQYVFVDRVYVLQMKSGITLKGVILSALTNCVSIYNNDGVTTSDDNHSSCNANSFYNCTIGNNVLSGLRLTNGTYNIYGGEIGGNGSLNTDPTQGGIVYNYNAALARGSQDIPLNINGVYIEATGGLADLVITADSGFNHVVKIDATMFNRLGSKFPTNSIAVTLNGAGSLFLNLDACSFTFDSFSYTPNAARPNIAIVENSTGKVYQHYTASTFWSSTVEWPAMRHVWSTVGDFMFAPNRAPALQIVASDTAVNWMRIAAGISGNAVAIFAQSDVDADVDLALVAKGAGSIDSSFAPLKIKSYAVASLPSAATYVQCLIYVFNGTANKRLAISDGTNWRWPDGAIVS